MELRPYARIGYPVGDPSSALRLLHQARRLLR